MLEPNKHQGQGPTLKEHVVVINGSSLELEPLVPQTAKVERELVDTVETDDPQQDQVAMGAQQGRSSIVQPMKHILD